MRLRHGTLRPSSSFSWAALGNTPIEWWDAERIDLITIATGVSSWLGTIAGYQIAQVTGSAQPAWSATSFNGAASVTYDGSDDVLTGADAGMLAALPTGATPCEIWGLVQQDAAASDSGARYLGGYASTSNAGRAISRGVAVGVVRGRMIVGDGAASTQLVNTSVELTTRHVMRAIIRASEIVMGVDQSETAPSAIVPNTGATRVRVGATPLNSTPSSFWQGKVAGFGIFRPMTTNQAIMFRSYLQGRRML